MIVIDDIVQGSPEWFSAKCGVPGASSFSKIVTTTGEPSKSAKDYMYQLAAEAITGQVEQGFQSAAMTMGIEREAESRSLYELINAVEVKQVGFIFNDSKMYGCSPDGVCETWGLELKNPLPKTQVKYLLDGKLPTEYFQQVQGSMLITGFERWDFMSHSPGLEPLIIQCEPDPRFQSKLKAELEGFCFELVKIIKKIKSG